MTNTITTDVLDVPGAHLYYEVRGSGPLVVLVAAPMDARSFGPLADLLATDHTVLTTDPRGINRSSVDDRGADSTPELRADDLARLITHLDAGKADVLGSSGGAVSVLALAQDHPELVGTVVAHEPPLQGVVDDHAELAARTEDMITTYLSGDIRGAWRMFFDMADMHVPEPVFEQMVGADRDAQAVADDDYQYTRMLRPTTRWMPDVERLRTVDARVLIGIGEDSAGNFCDRSARALTALLGTEPTMFGGGHIAFVDDPATFATRLRAVLSET
ncbi:alpha/beta fold hydrolase [Pseudonocardia sp. TRM90224]|uniref:alpha/beta fold hydrolase n=1 Tax=Pseudonocardia sp. TRM90224 TaxID=2812678 RepID=UPI001E6393D4|nr:alpha/beta hydrolase [Pseudonocardia sp. TRM90224]